MGSTAIVKENLAANSLLGLCPEPGNFFSQVPIQSGEEVEILVAPRSYQGINCVKVRQLSSNLEGYIYWNVFIKNFTMQTLVPGNDFPTAADKQAKLNSKKQKMAPPGYYVEYLVDTNGNIITPTRDKECCSVICIGGNATAKYTRYQTDFDWYSLNWNCAPTRKFMTTKQLIPYAKDSEMFASRYEYYPTWQELIARCQKPISPIAQRQKAPNDDFSA